MNRQAPGNLLHRAVGAATVCACVLLLGGCVHAAKPGFMRHYDLGGPAAVAANIHRAARTNGKILQIPRIAVPQWLEGTAMYYRLYYRGDNSLAAYGYSDWVAPPATLLASIIQSTLSANGGWRAVVGPGNPATADVSLHLRLDDFSQTFSQPHDSAGVIDATATLIDNRDGNVIAQRHFHVEIAAPTPDAQGGVKAMGKASRKLATDLLHWLGSGNPGSGQDAHLLHHQTNCPAR